MRAPSVPSLRLSLDEWSANSADYEWYLSEKKRVIEEQGTKVLDSLPENDAGCQELLETVIDWLPKRYPTLFDRLLVPEKEDGIFSKTTGETYRWQVGQAPDGKEALRIVSRCVLLHFVP